MRVYTCPECGHTWSVKQGGGNTGPGHRLGQSVIAANRIARDAETVPAIEKIESESEQPLGYLAIANRLREAGVPTARGGQWSPSAVRIIMRRNGMRP